MASKERVEAYERALTVLLGYDNVEQLREEFSRRIVIEATKVFRPALIRTRSSGQPTEFVLSTAIDIALESELSELIKGVDMRGFFFGENLGISPEQFERLRSEARRIWEERV
jgi:hypothetical protein